MSDEQLKTLDLNYRDPYGVVVHVIAWDREKNQVIFMRQGYPHECMQPVWKFQKFFTRINHEPVTD